MDNVTTTALKIMFLLGFTLHNIEEAVWLPDWSKRASKFHKPVESSQFIFADIVITMIGYIVTTLDILYCRDILLIHYMYLGFIGMMGINVFMPHLAGTIVLKKYSPGLLTGLFLNLPLSVIIISGQIKEGLNIYYVLLSIVIFSGITLPLLKCLFILGDKLFDYKE